jgi:hypothetical protein
MIVVAVLLAGIKLIRAVVAQAGPVIAVGVQPLANAATLLARIRSGTAILIIARSAVRLDYCNAVEVLATDIVGIAFIVRFRRCTQRVIRISEANSRFYIALANTALVLGEKGAFFISLAASRRDFTKKANSVEAIGHTNWTSLLITSSNIETV